MTQITQHCAAAKRPALLDSAGVKSATLAAFAKLAPNHAFGNPVMAVVWLGTLLCAVLTLMGKSTPAILSLIHI